MPLSMMCASMYSEALWQRVWASSDKKSLVFGASVACVMVFCVVFTFGLYGILGGVAGRTDFYTDDNLRVFYVLNDEYSGNVEVPVNPNDPNGGVTKVIPIVQSGM
eukprot:Pgem_evm1s14666